MTIVSLSLVQKIGDQQPSFVQKKVQRLEGYSSYIQVNGNGWHLKRDEDIVCSYMKV